MKRWLTHALWVGYLLVALYTFGYSAARSDADQRSCTERRQYQTQPETCIEFAAGNGLTAAALWPLYWSWEFQS